MSKITLIKDAAEKAIAIEFDRSRLLLGRAEKYAAGIIVIMGLQLWGTGSLLDSTSPWIRDAYYLVPAVWGVCLCLAMWAMKLKGYTSYPRGDKLLESLTPDTVSEAEAETAVVQMLLKVREQNARLNDAKTTLLFWGGLLFFAGFLLLASGYVFAVGGSPAPMTGSQLFGPQEGGE